ncbi:MAG TPA: hypothetical protein VFZ73_08450, partial [Gemmatimonadaceae bacterium]
MARVVIGGVSALARGMGTRRSGPGRDREPDRGQGRSYTGSTGSAGFVPREFLRNVRAGEMP